MLQFGERITHNTLDNCSQERLCKALIWKTKIVKKAKVRVTTNTQQPSSELNQKRIAVMPIKRSRNWWAKNLHKNVDQIHFSSRSLRWRAYKSTFVVSNENTQTHTSMSETNKVVWWWGANLNYGLLLLLFFHSHALLSFKNGYEARALLSSAIISTEPQ